MEIRQSLPTSSEILDIGKLSKVDENGTGVPPGFSFVKCEWLSSNFKIPFNFILFFILKDLFDDVSMFVWYTCLRMCVYVDPCM